jgi:hypothetical protein
MHMIRANVPGSLLLGLSLLSACSGEEPSHAEQVCLDTANEFTGAIVTACGEDPAATREQVLSGLRGCNGVAGIRDQASLYTECFPGLDALSCADLQAGALPAACQQQILFP